MNRFPIPNELKIEHYERRVQPAIFDRMDLVVKFIPGKDNIGAIVYGYIDAIKSHDDVVKRVEERWAEVDEIRKNFNKMNRQFRNMDGAWTSMNQRPDEFQEYLALLPKMKNIESRIERITDSIAKVKAEADFKRFKELEPSCSRLGIAFDALEKCRLERDQAREVLLKAEADFLILREEERRAAAQISEDHVIADEKDLHISSLFPNIQVGLVLSKLNDNEVENISFDEFLAIMKRLRSPHRAEFRRYDFRFDPFEGCWRSLQELRDMGVCIDDPMTVRMDMVISSANGDYERVRNMLIRGEDANSTDYTGCSALYMAATNRKPEVVELLLKAGANINLRDKNMMTPLLAVIERGYLDIMRLLLDLGADRTLCDRHNRGALYYSIIGGNVNIVRNFLSNANKNIPDSLWGFSPLHFAAMQGHKELVNFFLENNCSIFRKSKAGKTAEEVAKDAGYSEISLLLREVRQKAPAQLVHSIPDIEVEIWIGSHAALDPVFASDIGFTQCVCLMKKDDKAIKYSWISHDEHMHLETVQLHCLDEDNAEESWENTKAKLSQLLCHFFKILKNGSAKILICDYSGNSTSPSIVAILLLVKYQIRINETVQHCTLARPSTSISLSLLRGMEFLQRDFDAKKLKRSRDKIRTSTMMSSAF